MTDESPLIVKLLEYYGADLTRVSEVGWRPIKCPFHDDRTASASVNLNLGGFRCHACGMHGDAISLIKQREGLDYLGACEWAQATLGADAPQRQRSSRRQPRARSKWRDRLPL